MKLTKNLFLILLGLGVGSTMLAQDDEPKVEEAGGLDSVMAEYEEMDPLTLYDEQQEVQRDYNTALSESQLAGSRRQEYRDLIADLKSRPLPSDYDRRFLQEQSLIELEELERGAAYLERLNTKRVRAAKVRLEAIDSIMTVTTSIAGSGKESIFVTLNIPGRPVERKKIPLKDELFGIFDEEATKGRKQRKKIVETYLMFLTDVEEVLQEDTLTKMKENHDEFKKELDAEYELEISIRRAKGESTEDIELPPGYEERNPGKKINDEDLIAVPASGV